MKKFIALLLTLIMVFTMLPSAALADDPPPTPTPEPTPTETPAPTPGITPPAPPAGYVLFKSKDDFFETVYVDGDPHTLAYDLLINRSAKGIIANEYVDGEFSVQKMYVLHVPYLSGYEGDAKSFVCTNHTIIQGESFGDMDPYDFMDDPDVCNGVKADNSLMIPDLNGPTGELHIGTLPEEQTSTIDGIPITLPKVDVYRTAEFLKWGLYDNPTRFGVTDGAAMGIAVASAILLFVPGVGELVAIGSALTLIGSSLTIVDGIGKLTNPGEGGTQYLNLISYKYRYRIVIDNCVEYHISKIVYYDHWELVDNYIGTEYFRRKSIAFTDLPVWPKLPNGNDAVRAGWTMENMIASSLSQSPYFYTTDSPSGPNTDMVDTVLKPFRLVYCYPGYHDEIDTDNNHYCDLCGEPFVLSAPELNAAPAGQGSIRLSWNAINGATGYEIFYSNSENGVYYPIDIPRPDTEYTDSTVAVGATRYYKIRAYAAMPNTVTNYSVCSNIVSAVATLGKPEINAESVDYITNRVTWDSLPSADGYEVYYSNSPIGVYAKAGEVEAPATSFDHSALITGNTYYYKVIAYYLYPNGEKLYSPFSDIYSAIPELNTPVLVEADSEGYDSVTLDWNPVVGALGYRVSCSTDPDTIDEFIEINSIATSFTATGLETGVTYYFRVQAFRSYHCSDYSNRLSSVPIPATPTITRAVSTGYNSILLSWPSVEGATGYEIRNSAGDVLIGTTASTSFTETGLSTGITYYYKIRAYTTVNNNKIYSAYSAIASATTQLTKPTLISAVSASYTSNTLLWSQVDGASGYEISVSDSETGTYTVIADINSPTTTSYTHSGLTTGNIYYYKVRAYRMVNGNKLYSDYSNHDSAVPALDTPNLNSVNALCPKSIRLEWSTVPGAMGYSVYHYNIGGGTYSLVNSTTLTYYTDKDLTTGTSYSYKVRAYRIVNGVYVYSGYSNYLSNTPTASLSHSYSDCTDTDCNYCGATRTAPGHHYVTMPWVTVGTSGTCKKQLFACSNCSDEYWVYDTSHTWSDDCTDEYCNDCGYHRAAPGHAMSTPLWVAVGQPGVCKIFTNYCTRPGCSYTQIVSTDASHSFPAWSFNSSSHWRSCSECGYQDPSTGAHSYSYSWQNVGTLGTCRRQIATCGCGYSYVSSTDTSHTYNSWTSISSSQHRHSCTTCGYVQDGNHSFSAWSYSTSSVHRRTCSGCGYAQTQSHTWTYVGGGVYRCSVCGGNKVG